MPEGGSEPPSARPAAGSGAEPSGGQEVLPPVPHGVATGDAGREGAAPHLGNGHVEERMNGHDFEDPHGKANGQLNGHAKKPGKPGTDAQAPESTANGESSPLKDDEGGDPEKGRNVKDKQEGEDEEKKETQVSPEQSANPISRLFFLWLNPLMRVGWKKALEQEDLPPLPDWDDAKAVSVGFAEAWEAEKKNKGPKASLTLTMFRAFWYRLTAGAVLQLITVLLALTPPIFLNSVLNYLQGSENNFMYKIFGYWYGYYAAAALLVIPTIRSLVDAQLNNIMFRLGIHVKTALVEIVYGKSLRLSNSARQAKSVGEIVTLMQVDTEKISMTTPFLHQSWSAIIQILLNLGLLIYYIGWSAITGFALLLITIPTQGKLVSLLLKMQRKILINTGKRVKVINEVLQGMRVVKCYAWEEPFRESVTDIRAVELGAMRQRVWLRAVQSCIMLATPTLIMVVTFAFYAGVAKQYMDPALVFTALSLFNSLRIPLMMYPFVINALLAGHVSIQRVGKFLSSPELTAVDKNEEGGKEEVAVEIKHASFKWSSAKPPPPVKGGKGPGMPGIGGPGGMSMRPGNPGSFAAPGGARGGASFNGAPGGSSMVSQDSRRGLGGLLRRRKKGQQENQAGTEKKEEGKKEEQQPFALKDINLTVRRGELLAVVGPVGSGKSSLVSAILGEMETARRSGNGDGDSSKVVDPQGGGEGERPADAAEASPAAGETAPPQGRSVKINGTVAYCSQQAWIMNASLRQNILFGHEYEEERYNTIIEACALKQDLASLPDGDSTEIGERGINLSGGQKQRVSLARAVYADTDIILLDDPLSAVDAHVGAHLFENCIHGIMQGRTRIFVTNQLQFVPECDSIAVVNNGTVVEQGAYQALMSQGGEFARLMLESGSHRQNTQYSDSGGFRSSSLRPADRGGRASSLLSHSISRGRSLGGSRARMESTRKARYTKQGTLVEQEQRAKGMLSLDVYWKYWTEASKIVPLGVLALYLAVQAVDAYSRYWLAYWTKDQYNQTTAFYLGIYAALALFYTILIYFRTLGQAFLGLWTAQGLHQGMLSSVLRAPMSFFDTTPVGRVLNRFSSDQAAVDETLPFSWSAFLNILFQVFGTIVVISIVTPIFLAAFVPVALLYFYIQQVYRKTARELKRLEAVSKSPVYQQFTETLNGLPIIRAYGQEERFLRMCDDKCDVHNRSSFLLKCCDRWLSVRLELMGNSLVCAAAMLAVAQRGTLFAGFAGIAIDYALQITASLGMLVRQMTDTENQMNGVERMLEYRDRIEHEAPAIIPDHRPAADWPPKGAIQVDKVSMRYRPSLPLVLKSVSLGVEGGERMGVVGRTGSGKSSLMLCLFRLVEPCEGRILIDGLDIASIGLDDLRSRLSIIPQDPVLFSGSVRSNLDPFKKHTDEELWVALEHAHLKAKISSLPAKLEAEVAEYGENFSVGERQLLCLGRVLLRKNRILVMDEATSSVDFETDRLIQSTIRTYLKDSTMLIIAHRINTVIDASRILVLADGEVAEFDTPARLLEVPNGRFASLVEDTGEQTAQHLRKVARGEEDFFASYTKKD